MFRATRRSSITEVSSHGFLTEAKPRFDFERFHLHSCDGVLTQDRHVAVLFSVAQSRSDRAIWWVLVLCGVLTIRCIAIRIALGVT